MNTQVLAPVYDSRNYCDVSYLDSVCVWNEEKDTLTIFAVNKSLEEDLEISCDLRQFEGYQVTALQEGDEWIVSYSLSEDTAGGGPQLRIRASDGKVVSFALQR